MNEDDIYAINELFSQGVSIEDIAIKLETDPEVVAKFLRVQEKDVHNDQV